MQDKIIDQAFQRVKGTWAILVQNQSGRLDFYQGPHGIRGQYYKYQKIKPIKQQLNQQVDLKNFQASIKNSCVYIYFQTNFCNVNGIIDPSGKILSGSWIAKNQEYKFVLSGFKIS